MLRENNKQNNKKLKLKYQINKRLKDSYKGVSEKY
jgi:hypothetical protein